MTRRVVPMAVSLLALGCADGPTSPGPEEGGALEIVVQGLSSPVWVTSAPGDISRLFVVEKPGRIRIVRGGALVAEPFLDISAQTSASGERGLLGLAFHPDFASNGQVFVDHTDLDGNTRVLRYTLSANPDVLDPASEQRVLQVDQPYPNHNGGQISFGRDGMLYIALGDGGSGGDPLGHGQNRATLLGSILRIDVDATSPYAIPADNPFVGDPNAAPEIWLYGVRNPWRFAFDAQLGDLYVADVGQSEVEEVTVVPGTHPGGANLGWNVLEGSDCHAAPTCDSSGTLLPTYEYGHAEGCSVTGGLVYRGTAAPALTGRYFFGDFCAGWIRSFRYSSGEATDVYDHTEDFGAVGSLASFGEDALGDLYVVSLTGTVYRLVAPR